nr:MAG TPA: hypothetical protein [Caudoviricetes sp.]
MTGLNLPANLIPSFTESHRNMPPFDVARQY